MGLARRGATLGGTDGDLRPIFMLGSVCEKLDGGAGGELWLDGGRLTKLIDVGGGEEASGCGTILTAGDTVGVGSCWAWWPLSGDVVGGGAGDDTGESAGGGLVSFNCGGGTTGDRRREGGGAVARPVISWMMVMVMMRDPPSYWWRVKAPNVEVHKKITEHNFKM
ncbi:hypothetical protein L7F22_064347 [Adiantum nelumboides]|nr:hypothetical protein [Adiantum nelumboides]